MYKDSSKSYIYLIAVLLILMCLPRATAESLRGGVVAFLSPFWEKVGRKGDAEVQRLQLENQLLHSEIERLQEVVLQELLLKEIESVHDEEIENYLQLQLQSIPARVIFRTPSTWNSSLWLNVGKRDNARLEKAVVGKNSPVLVGMSVIGVVDYVGEHQCRVRLITDSGLNPSVRAARGVDRSLIDPINALLGALEDEELREKLLSYKDILLEGDVNAHLAKGELSGCSLPMWRAQGQILKGTGFNYDFSDEEGSARDLRTGLPLDAPGKKTAVPLIRTGDLLVTTGMDGVFPKGLNIAKVISVSPLKEGDYYYDIKAVPTAGNLNEIDLVMVLPPIGFNPTDRPTFLN